MWEFVELVVGVVLIILSSSSFDAAFVNSVNGDIVDHPWAGVVCEGVLKLYFWCVMSDLFLLSLPSSVSGYPSVASAFHWPGDMAFLRLCVQKLCAKLYVLVRSAYWILSMFFILLSVKLFS